MEILKSLSRAEQITAASAVVLFVSLFVPWLDSLSAWQLFTVLGPLLALLAAATVALTLARPGGVVLPVRRPTESIIRDVAIVSASVTAAWFLESELRGPGAWLSVLGAAGMVYGAVTLAAQPTSALGDEGRAGRPAPRAGAAAAGSSLEGGATSGVPNRRLREDLLGHAYAIEVETQGFLPRAGFLKSIDQGILPHTRPDETEASLLVPIVMSVDRENSPVEFPDETAAVETGLVACMSDRAIFTWIVGLVRARVYTHVEYYRDIRDVSGFSARNLSGIDVTARSKWSVLFGEQIRDHLVQEWRSALAQELSAGSSDDRREPPTAHREWA